MKSLIISCPTLRYELEAALKEYDSSLPVRYIPQQLHNEPNRLHEYLQTLIDENVDFDCLYICISSCGGGTNQLKATTAELVIPRTRDCVDILLSNMDSLDSLERPFDGCLFTRGWVDFNESSEHSLTHLSQSKGREYAEAFLRKLYGDFNHFYFIDTGLGHLSYIQEKMMPLVEILHGSSQVISGQYGILRKLVKENIDGDFLQVHKGETVDTSSFLVWG